MGGGGDLQAKEYLFIGGLECFSHSSYEQETPDNL